MSSQSSNIGCGLWMVLTTLFFAVLSFASNLPSSTPTAIPASVPITVTFTPETTDKYFVVENNLITYAYSPTLGMPCYYEMTGRVIDLKGQPYSKFIVNIKMLGELAPKRLGYAFPGENSFIENGISGWGALLPHGLLVMRYG